jgi:hypothetical protein
MSLVFVTDAQGFESSDNTRGGFAHRHFADAGGMVRAGHGAMSRWGRASDGLLPDRALPLRFVCASPAAFDSDTGARHDGSQPPICEERIRARHHAVPRQR